ncbi:unnamed protein product [Echinostoma caproni]|uniref:C2H2-type domain-containing protein n=1 Tax=Echinostoma caproni TaxID=27848 RepID=A0A183ALE2_9TREM|nr:unnamed protein product [Echinostoma caproni]
MPQSESAMTHDFSNPLFSRFARSYWDHLHGSKQGKSLTESEANYRCTNLDTPYSSSPCQSKKSTLSNSLVLSGSVNDSILNPLFGGTLNNPVNRYSPPLNFSAFTSFDQNMICPICRKCFRFEKNLLRHLQKTHATGTGESVLKCKLCNYTTRHYSNMYVHIRTHTGDKPYSCSACGVSFTQGSSLKLHIRSRHEDNAKYFSLTRKPGKNNLTKLWTRVLKKDLPKYNSVMANTLLNRSKFWSRPDPIQLNPFGLVQSKLLPVDINLPGSNQFGWNSSTPASVMPTPFKSVNRLNYAQSSKSTQNHVQRNGTGSSVDGFETELPGLDVVRDTESSHTSARFVNRETADDIFRPAGWPMDRKRRVRRQKTEQTELSTVMDGDKAGNISCSVEGYQNNKAYMSYLTKTEGLSPRRDDSYVAPHLYNCERGQEISNRSVCRATVPADWIERESSALFSSPQPKASHYSRSDYVLHEKRDSEQSDFKHYPESGPRTAGLTQPLSNPDTTRQHY